MIASDSEIRAEDQERLGRAVGERLLGGRVPVDDLWSCLRSLGSKIRRDVETVRVVTYHISLPDSDPAWPRPIGCCAEPKLKPRSGRCSPRRAVPRADLERHELAVAADHQRAGVAATQPLICGAGALVGADLVPDGVRRASDAVDRDDVVAGPQERRRRPACPSRSSRLFVVATDWPCDRSKPRRSGTRSEVDPGPGQDHHDPLPDRLVVIGAPANRIDLASGVPRSCP